MVLNVKVTLSLLNSLPSSVTKNRKPIQTKFRMPLLNWQALKPSQVTGTVFNEMDDEEILGVRRRRRRSLQYLLTTVSQPLTL